MLNKFEPRSPILYILAKLLHLERTQMLIMHKYIMKMIISTFLTFASRFLFWYVHLELNQFDYNHYIGIFCNVNYISHTIYLDLKHAEINGWSVSLSWKVSGKINVDSWDNLSKIPELILSRVGIIDKEV